MKQELINILNGLNVIEVKGQSVMILAQCISQLVQILDSMPDDKSKSTEENKSE